MARAFGLEADVIDFGSLICLVSGPEVCAAAGPQTKRTKKGKQVFPKDFMMTSFQAGISPAFHADSKPRVFA
jgi:hypothetical protein